MGIFSYFSVVLIDFPLRTADINCLCNLDTTAQMHSEKQVLLKFGELLGKHQRRRVIHCTTCMKLNKDFTQSWMIY